MLFRSIEAAAAIERDHNRKVAIEEKYQMAESAATKAIVDYETRPAAPQGVELENSILAAQKERPNDPTLTAAARAVLDSRWAAFGERAQAEALAERQAAGEKVDNANRSYAELVRQATKLRNEGKLAEANKLYQEAQRL